MGSQSLSILFLGDIVGRPGRRVVAKYLASADRPQADAVIVNVENSAHGFGITEQNVKELYAVGANILTGGNHTFDRKETFGFIDNYPTLLRPANYPEGTPGRGWCLYTVDDVTIGVINLMGRVFMEPLRSPFLIADELIGQLSKQTNIIFVDMHAEATAEKVALGRYIDGRVSVLAGTHTHVPTADERILPGGTAYITDAGCCGPIDGVIGMDFEAVQRRLVEQLPARFEVAEGPAMACGILVKVAKDTGKGISIKRVSFLETDLSDERTSIEVEREPQEQAK